MNKYTVGIDVGGTNIKIGLLNARGKILTRTRLATKGFKRSRIKLINAIAEAVLLLLREKKLAKSKKVNAKKALSAKLASASYYMIRDQVPFNSDKLFA